MSTPETPETPPETPPETAQGAPAKTDLERFVESLSGFDPGEILTEVKRLGSDVASSTAGISETVSAAVSSALEGPLAELQKTIKDLAKQVKGSAPPSSATPAKPAPPPPASPDASSASKGAGVAETLFGIPKVGE